MSSVSPEIKLVSRFVRNLLDYDPNLIEFGRLNEEQENSSLNYIAIDSVLSSNPLAKGSSFNGDTEVQKRTRMFQKDFTISFYGVDAYTNKDLFEMMIGDQKSYDLQFELKVKVFPPKGSIDVKQLMGASYANRIDVTVNVVYNKSIEVSVKRIDTLNHTLIINK